MGVEWQPLPMPVGLCADVEGQLKRLAGIEPGAAHLDAVPAGAEVAGPHLRVGLEAAGSEDDGLRGHVLGAPAGPDPDPGHGARAVLD